MRSGLYHTVRYRAPAGPADCEKIGKSIAYFPYAWLNLTFILMAERRWVRPHKLHFRWHLGLLFLFMYRITGNQSYLSNPFTER